MGTMKLSYLHLLLDCDHLLSLAGDYLNALRRKEEEVDRLSRELEDTRASVVNTPLALQDLERHGDEHGMELSLVSSCIHIQDTGTVSDRYVELVGISHITQVRSLLELPANSSLRIWA